MKPYGGFEGNAQTLRILTQTIFSEKCDGMNPTRAMLDGVLKYKTLQAETPKAKNHYIYNEQAAWLDFVLGGEAFPSELAPGDERNSFKSIECQIMDWADDTAYSLNDVADGIRAGFINLERLERWANAQSLSADDAKHVATLSEAIRKGNVESKLAKLIGSKIRAVTLRPASNFLSSKSQRHSFELAIDPAIKARTKLNKQIALELVFRSPALQQLDHKADVILRKLFGVLQDRYIERTSSSLHLLPVEVEQLLAETDDKSMRARLVCDWIANMTDPFAFRTYRRLFDAEFGSIMDLV
jgi:dGTPase